MSGNLGHIHLRVSFGHHNHPKTIFIHLHTATVSDLRCSTRTFINGFPKFTHPKLQEGVATGGVAVDAEFVDCYKYSVVDLQIIVCIRRHVTLVYPIYPLFFAFQSEHNLEASYLLTLGRAQTNLGKPLFAKALLLKAN